MKAIDANVIIHGRGLDGDLVTVPEVMDELKSEKASSSVHGFQIDTFSPSQEAIEKVNGKAEEINSKASKVDQKLLALAMEKDIELITDDKELQNLGLHLDVDVSGFLDPVTDKKMTWKVVCPNCGKRECSCGTTPVRKLDQCSSV
ncbi:MAG: hypothetical protein R6V35_04880 [Candidatus Nanohaloarchaea archaeon]